MEMGMEMGDRTHLHFFVTNVFGLGTNRRLHDSVYELLIYGQCDDDGTYLHGHQRKDLSQMILHYIANDSCTIIKLAIVKGRWRWRWRFDRNKAMDMTTTDSAWEMMVISYQICQSIHHVPVYQYLL